MFGRSILFKSIQNSGMKIQKTNVIEPVVKRSGMNGTKSTKVIKNSKIYIYKSNEKMFNVQQS